jgi:hypothetical protein
MDGVAPDRRNLRLAVPNPHPALRATFSRGEKEKSGECEEMDHG